MIIEATFQFHLTKIRSHYEGHNFIELKMQEVY